MYINDVYPSNSKVTKWIQKENCPSQVSNGQIKEEFKSVFSGKQPVLEFMEELAASSGKDAGINHKKIVSYRFNVFCPLVCPNGSPDRAVRLQAKDGTRTRDIHLGKVELYH